MPCNMSLTLTSLESGVHWAVQCDIGTANIVWNYTTSQHTPYIHHNTELCTNTPLLLWSVQYCTESSSLVLHSHIHHICSLHSTHDGRFSGWEVVSDRTQGEHGVVCLPFGAEAKWVGRKGDRSAANRSGIQKAEKYGFCMVSTLCRHTYLWTIHHWREYMLV